MRRNVVRCVIALACGFVVNAFARPAFAQGATAGASQVLLGLSIGPVRGDDYHELVTLQGMLGVGRALSGPLTSIEVAALFLLVPDSAACDVVFLENCPSKLASFIGASPAVTKRLFGTGGVLHVHAELGGAIGMWYHQGDRGVATPLFGGLRFYGGSRGLVAITGRAILFPSANEGSAWAFPIGVMVRF